MLFSKSTKQSVVTRRKLARLKSKIESEETFLNLSYFLQSNAALSVGCYYARRDHDNSYRSCACLKKKKSLLAQGFSCYECVNIIISQYTKRS